MVEYYLGDLGKFSDKSPPNNATHNRNSYGGGYFVDLPRGDTVADLTATVLCMRYADFIGAGAPESVQNTLLGDRL